MQNEGVVEADDSRPHFCRSNIQGAAIWRCPAYCRRELERRKVIDGVFGAAVDELIARDEQQGRPAPVVRTGEHGRRIGAVALDREQQAVGIVCQRDLQVGAAASVVGVDSGNRRSRPLHGCPCRRRCSFPPRALHRSLRGTDRFRRTLCSTSSRRAGADADGEGSACERLRLNHAVVGRHAVPALGRST